MEVNTIGDAPRSGVESFGRKTLSVLGSTGSIGVQTLEAAKKIGLTVTALSGNINAALMERQAREFSPRLVAMADRDAAKDLRARLRDTDIEVSDNACDAAREPSDIVGCSIVGIAGLEPTLEAVRVGGRRIALSNKESLVCGGRLFMDAVRENNCELVPVDSEHSAIFQCLQCRADDHFTGKRENNAAPPYNIILTASGGPFRSMTEEQLAGVTPEMALRHPNWSMGAKVTIDSATMMNKGLEVIEASLLFDVPPENIEVLVHPQSIVHSAVRFRDNSVIAQLAVPDMRLPIQYALTYPERCPSLAKSLDLADVGTLTFSRPDLKKFPCLAIALGAASVGGAEPVVMNAANEIAVKAFLEGKTGFNGIAELVRGTLDKCGEFAGTIKSVRDIISADSLARDYTERQIIKKL